MSGKRKRQVALSRVLERAQQPSFLLDNQSIIVAANEALAALLSLSLDDIIGQRLRYHAMEQDDPIAHLVQGLCPPPGRLTQAPEIYDAEINDASRSSTRCYRASISPLRDDKQIDRWFVVLSIEPNLPNDSSDEVPEAQRLHRRLVQQRRLTGSTSPMQPLLGESAWMQQARDQFELAKRHRPRVLLSGPPGSGCLELAQAIHYATEDAGPLIPLDCAILDAELLQSTVFQAKKWMMDQPELQQGWFLLKNLETLRRDAQNELMGMLGLPNFELPTIATSVLSMDQLSKHPDFNSQLARLLGTLVISLPPLSERAEDIPLIAQARIEDHNLNHDRQLEGFDADAMDDLCTYAWPGNLDEFHMLMTEVLKQVKGPVIRRDDLPRKFEYAKSADRHAANPVETIELDKYLASIEQELIDRALRIAGGNKTRAAELLGVSRARIHRKSDSDSTQNSEPNPPENDTTS